LFSDLRAFVTEQWAEGAEDFRQVFLGAHDGVNVFVGGASSWHHLAVRDDREKEFRGALAGDGNGHLVAEEAARLVEMLENFGDGNGRRASGEADAREEARGVGGGLNIVEDQLAQEIVAAFTEGEREGLEDLAAKLGGFVIAAAWTVIEETFFGGIGVRRSAATAPPGVTVCKIFHVFKIQRVRWR
jgi:hypothetical protein